MQSKVIWNSSNSSIVGFSMSSDDFTSLHDVFKGLSSHEKCQETSYVIQFLWRDISSSFDVVGPFFTSSSTLQTSYLHSMVTRVMLSFIQFGFDVRALVCDGASSNLCLLKMLSNNVGHNDISDSSFLSPFDGKPVHIVPCPSHQVY